MEVVNTNELRVNQKKVNFNPTWVEHVKKAERDIKSGNVTAIKSKDIWTKVREMNTH